MDSERIAWWPGGRDNEKAYRWMGMKHLLFKTIKESLCVFLTVFLWVRTSSTASIHADIASRQTS